jgi:hypothetical protein
LSLRLPSNENAYSNPEVFFQGKSARIQNATMVETNDRLAFLQIESKAKLELARAQLKMS